ncbi:hypothetical protein ATO13_22266 [Stappia sp. 22II-S9-Z10]|nr:hypothetical protein ATO13_22266 [Stappia sp. 22II-S9-Z10]
MSIIITNISERGTPDNIRHRYRLQINTETIVDFEHVRCNGLAACLREAARAVEASGHDEEWREALEMTPKEDRDDLTSLNRRFALTAAKGE